MKSFTDLEAWKAAMALAKDIYAISALFPAEERYGLTAQMRRAAAGILANIGEGFSRASALDKSYKYTIARGECAEVHALLLLAVETMNIDRDRIRHCVILCSKTGKLLSGLVRRFGKGVPSPSPSPSPSVG